MAKSHEIAGPRRMPYSGVFAFFRHCSAEGATVRKRHETHLVCSDALPADGQGSLKECVLVHSRQNLPIQR